jgi:nitroreductase
MNNTLEFIYKRHSVRKFKDQPVPLEDIKKIIKAATYAPSGKNLQNWHFVVVNNQKIIQQMALIIEKKIRKTAEYIKEEAIKNRFLKSLDYSTIFKNAPVTILVFAGPYPTTGLEIFKAINASEEEIAQVEKPNPGIQNIGAAMENLLLAAANLGYGTCWMTSPNVAAKELSEVVGFHKEGYYLAAITPLGLPIESELSSPPRKPLEEVMTILD